MNNLDELIRKKLQKQIDDSHTIVCQNIDADPTLTPIKKRYLKRASYKLCKHELLLEHNRLLDLHNMISEDLASRELQKMPIDVCKCREGNTYCFCVTSKNNWLKI